MIRIFSWLRNKLGVVKTVSLLLILVMFLFLLLGVAGWFFQRDMHYSFAYKGMVESQIKRDHHVIDQRFKLLEDRVSQLEAAR